MSPPVTPPITPPVRPPILPPGRPPEDLTKLIWGRADATLHIHDENQDVTYTSNIVDLLFVPYQRQGQEDAPGQTQYLLAGSGGKAVPTVIWTVEGKVFDCTVEGQARVTLPFVDPALDPTRPAFGYMVVVGPDDGDFHSVMVSAFDPNALLTKTCPGDPSVVTKEPFGAGFLLHIPWQKNDREGGRVIYRGQKSYDSGNPLDFLNLLPPGAAIPDEARQALSQASGPGTSRRYSWKWELEPLSRD